jgi:hypothetical protein
MSNLDAKKGMDGPKTVPQSEQPQMERCRSLFPLSKPWKGDWRQCQLGLGHPGSHIAAHVNWRDESDGAMSLSYPGVPLTGWAMPPAAADVVACGPQTIADKEPPRPVNLYPKPRTLTQAIEEAARICIAGFAAAANKKNDSFINEAAHVISQELEEIGITEQSFRDFRGERDEEIADLRERCVFLEEDRDQRRLNAMELEKKYGALTEAFHLRLNEVENLQRLVGNLTADKDELQRQVEVLQGNCVHWHKKLDALQERLGAGGPMGHSVHTVSGVHPGMAVDTCGPDPQTAQTGEPQAGWSKTPCCHLMFQMGPHKYGPIFWNEFNQVVECHHCGQVYQSTAAGQVAPTGPDTGCEPFRMMMHARVLTPIPPSAEKWECKLSDDLHAAVFEAVGAASACWMNLEGAGVFKSDHAKKVAEALWERIDALASVRRQPGKGEHNPEAVPLSGARSR